MILAPKAEAERISIVSDGVPSIEKSKSRTNEAVITRLRRGDSDDERPTESLQEASHVSYSLEDMSHLEDSERFLKAYNGQGHYSANQSIQTVFPIVHRVSSSK